MRKDQSNETAFIGTIADMLTGGWFSVLRWFGTVLFTINHMSLGIFLRKNMGRIAAREGSITLVTMYFLLLAATSFTWAYYHPIDYFLGGRIWSLKLFIMHGGLYIAFKLWRRFGALSSLRSRQEYTARDPHEIGESVLYPFAGMVLRPLGLIPTSQANTRWYSITELRWMQWIEPILLLLIGFFMIRGGFTLYGKYLIIATICHFAFIFKVANTMANLRQSPEVARRRSSYQRPEDEETDEPITIIS